MTKTKQRSVVLRPHEARRLAEHGEVLCVRVVKPQPHPSCSEDGCGWHWHPKGRGDNYIFGTDEIHLLGGMLDYSPFGRVGDELWGKEDYSSQGWFAEGAFLQNASESPPDAVMAGTVYYKASGDRWQEEGRRCKQFARDVHGHYGWYPARSMPAAFSRFPRLVVEKVECRRITTVTEDEAVTMGLQATEEGERRGAKTVLVHSHESWQQDEWCWFATLRRTDT